MENSELAQLIRGDIIYYYDPQTQWSKAMILSKGLNYVEMVSLEGAMKGKTWKERPNAMSDMYSLEDPTPPPKRSLLVRIIRFVFNIK